MNYFKFSSSAIALIRSYLSARLKYVTNGNETSGLLPISCGVPQGSVLGPLLFSLFINDLPNVLTYASPHLYADDFQMYISSSVAEFSESIVKINHDLASISLWALENGLRLNEKKSQALIINNKNSIVPQTIKLNGEAIHASKNVKKSWVNF